MTDWAGRLGVDPRPALAESANPAVAYLARRDVDDETGGSRTSLSELSECEAILRRQRHDGGWRYPGGKPGIRSQTNYDQLETYRQLGVLVEKFELTRSHPAIRRAAGFLMGFQSTAGDFRGIYGSQYSRTTPPRSRSS